MLKGKMLNIKSLQGNGFELHCGMLDFTGVSGDWFASGSKDLFPPYNREFLNRIILR